MYGLDLVIVIDGIPVGVTRFGRKETLLVDFITKESQHQTETGTRTFFWLQKDILWYSENMVHINGKFYLNLSKGYDNNTIRFFVLYFHIGYFHLQITLLFLGIMKLN